MGALKSKEMELLGQLRKDVESIFRFFESKRFYQFITFHTRNNKSKAFYCPSSWYENIMKSDSFSELRNGMLNEGFPELNSVSLYDDKYLIEKITNDRRKYLSNVEPILKRFVEQIKSLKSDETFFKNEIAKLELKLSNSTTSEPDEHDFSSIISQFYKPATKDQQRSDIVARLNNAKRNLEQISTDICKYESEITRIKNDGNVLCQSIIGLDLNNYNVRNQFCEQIKTEFNSALKDIQSTIEHQQKLAKELRSLIQLIIAGKVYSAAINFADEHNIFKPETMQKFKELNPFVETVELKEYIWYCNVVFYVKSIDFTRHFECPYDTNVCVPDFDGNDYDQIDPDHHARYGAIMYNYSYDENDKKVVDFNSDKPDCNSNFIVVCSCGSPFLVKLRKLPDEFILTADDSTYQRNKNIEIIEMSDADKIIVKEHIGDSWKNYYVMHYGV